MALSRNRQSPKAEFVVPALVAATGLYDPELEGEVGVIDGEAYTSSPRDGGRTKAFLLFAVPKSLVDPSPKPAEPTPILYRVAHWLPRHGQ